MKKKHKVMLATIGVCVVITIISILGYHYPKQVIMGFLGLTVLIIVSIIVTIIYYVIDNNFFDEDNDLIPKENNSENK